MNLEAFTIIIPSIGRDSLRVTLDSIRMQHLVDGDKVLLVSDGFQGGVFNTYIDYTAEHPNFPIELAVIHGPNNDWGHTPRNITMSKATTPYILHIDDDDVYVPGAFDLIRERLKVQPGVPHIFRCRFQDGFLVWHTKNAIEWGNVATPTFVQPNLFRRHAKWPPIAGGDMLFWKDTVDMYPPGTCVWHEDVIAEIRPKSPGT